MLFTRRSVASTILVLLAATTGPARGDMPLASRIRRPVALAVAPDGTRLYVANERSGTLSVVDPARDRVVGEVAVGRAPVDLAMRPDGRGLLVVDREAGEVRRVNLSAGTPRLVGATAVPADPVGIVALAGAMPPRFAVTSLRARTLTIVEASGGDAIRTVATHALPFSPRRLAWLAAARRVVVADAYGGALALVDPERGVASVRSVPGQNLRGLAVSPDGRWLVVAHQVLERTAAATFDNVHFGALMRNNLLILPVDDVTRAATDETLLARGRVADLEGFGNGGGDPAGVAFDRDGGVVVALAGVGEVGLSVAPTGQLRRVRAGLRPTAVAVRPDGREAYAVDTAGDAVWVIELPSGLRRRAISLGPRPEPDAVERGERLFHDARLSHDHWLSCQSCHADGHTTGRLADTHSDGSYGTPKRILSLLGVGDTGPWGWTGGFERLEDQVRASITSTMQGDPPTDAQVADLTAYVRSLPAPRPDPTTAADSAVVARGRAVFEARRCDRCHAPPEYTAPRTFDVGLPDEAGHRQFNPPSLRGVGRRAPLLHDARAGTLEEVFTTVKHPRGEDLSPADLDDLLAFLRSL